MTSKHSPAHEEISNPGMDCYFNTHELFALGTDAHITGLLLDIDDPYFGNDKVDVDTQNLVEFHKQELVRQAVAFRCPPEKDKKALATRYATLSKKKMDELLNQSALKGKPKKHKLDHRADLEREIQEMEIEMAIESRDQLARRNQTMRDGCAASNGAAEEDEYVPAEKPMTSDGVEFSDYLLLDHLEDEQEQDSQMESPYSRKNATVSRQSMNRPLSHRHTGTGTDINRQTYQDAHGKLGWRAELMAPSPVRNPSAKFLHEQTKRKKEDAKHLYLHALDEAVLMQQRYLTCVTEANIFSAALNKGNVYRVMERDLTEDQQWKRILDPKIKAVGEHGSIPKGTGQRIAKMLVEVCNPDRDLRYLSTGHFFREHGRLQHELQRKCAVEGLSADFFASSVRSEFGSESTESPTDTPAASSSPKARRPKSASHAFSASKDSVSIPQRSVHNSMPSSSGIDGDNSEASALGIPSLRRPGNKSAARQTLPTVNESNDRRPTSASGPRSPPNRPSSPGQADRNQQQVKKPVSYQEYRREIEDQLKKILSAIVTRAHEIQSQTEFIKASGWNWLGPTDSLPGA